MRKMLRKMMMRKMLMRNKMRMMLKMQPPECGGGCAAIGATEAHPTRGRSEHPTGKVHLG